eukprot:gb/GECH01000649.1/.p1 GENE.gb/GECH01000649.1/~~gb/GECH01000649.1/.p1  ORF type:complete len:758 (+),score=164.05 gb/GECH01000649.1/:1-2274(+)
MRLETNQRKKPQHKDVCSGVAWSSRNELFSCGDDKTIWKWNMEGEVLSKLSDVNEYCITLDWFPIQSKRQSTTTDIFLVAFANGKYSIISKSGRIERTVDAHEGAVVSIKWSNEGTSIATGGEDGNLRIWSQSGQLRSTLASTGKCLYSIAWGPEGNDILFTSGNDLIIKPLQPSSRQTHWRAHDGPIMQVDWNPVTKLIVSAGEDGKYKVWDRFGTNIFTSTPFDHAITSVSWCPDGTLFSVGSFNLLRICDANGCTQARSSPETGSILNVSWMANGTQIAAAGGNGHVLFGSLVDRTVEWNSYAATITELRKIQITDSQNELIEELDFTDPVIKMSLAYNHLVVATSNQCFIYKVNNWTTPQVLDVKDTINLIIQCEKVFLTVDNFSGIQVLSYEGRLLCNPKFSGLRTEFLNPESISLSNDYVAILDKIDPYVIQLFDVRSGKQLTEKIKHQMEIEQVALSQYGDSSERKLALIDRNQNLFMTLLSRIEMCKLATVVSSVSWNDYSDILIAISDGIFSVWYYPYVVFIDKSILELTFESNKENEFGTKAKITNFNGTKATIKKKDGTTHFSYISPYPFSLYKHISQKKWEAAIQFCRFLKERMVWACLAVMSIKHGELDTAEVAMAALELPDKLEYIVKIKSIPLVERRNAELALYQRRPQEAENILMQAGLVFRAIKMRMNLYNWDRALEIAVQHKTHVDTVLAYRKKYLKMVGKEETLPGFNKLNEQIEVDWENVKAKIEKAKENENERSSS